MANGTQYSFQRIEKKYFISPAQMEALLNVMRRHMTADRYGEYAIGNIYCDTDNFRLIRASLEKVKTTNMGTLYELCYRITLRQEPVPKVFLDELRCRNGNLNITCCREESHESL